jgi:hypothetical protein
LDPISRAALLKTEAGQVIAHLDLTRILSSVAGRVEYTGSYLLDLMAYPDIDLMAGKVAVEQVFQAGGQLVRSPQVVQAVYEPSDDPDLPGGLYFKLRVAWGEWIRPWKIDIWFLDDAIIERKLADMRRFQAALTPDLRHLILRYKDSVLTPEGRTPMYSGYWIYRAVLDEGLRDFREISAYLSAHGIQIDL